MAIDIFAMQIKHTRRKIHVVDLGRVMLGGIALNVDMVRHCACPRATAGGCSFAKTMDLNGSPGCP